MMFLFSKQTVCYLHGRPCAPSKGFHGLIKLWQVQGKRCAKSETLGMPSHTKHLDWHGPRMYRSSSVASIYIRDRVYSFLANNPQGIIVLIIFSNLCFHHRRTQIIHRRKCLACPIAAMPSPIALFVAISLPWRALTVSFLHSVNFQRPILVFSIGDGWWWELFILSVWERVWRKNTSCECRPCDISRATPGTRSTGPVPVEQKPSGVFCFEIIVGSSTCHSQLS